MLFTFRLQDRSIGFIESATVENALSQAQYLWRRDYHKCKNAAGVLAWLDILNGVEITTENHKYVFYDGALLSPNVMFKI